MIDRYFRFLWRISGSLGVYVALVFLSIAVPLIVIVNVIKALVQ